MIFDCMYVCMYIYTVCIFCIHSTYVHVYVCSQCVHSLTELQDHVAVWGSKKMLVYNVVPDKETIKTIGTGSTHAYIRM